MSVQQTGPHGATNDQVERPPSRGVVRRVKPLTARQQAIRTFVELQGLEPFSPAKLTACQRVIRQSMTSSELREKFHRAPADVPPARHTMPERVRAPRPVARAHGRQRRSPAAAGSRRSDAGGSDSGSSDSDPHEDPAPAKPSYSTLDGWSGGAWEPARICRCERPIIEAKHDYGYEFGCVLCGHECREVAS
jgi:hypothetical protein